MQIISAPVLGPGQRARWGCATEHFHTHGTRLLAHVMDVERRAEARVVAEADALLAWSPYSPRNNYQLNVAAETHHGSFTDATDETLDALARHLPRFVRAALDGSRKSDFNLIFHLPPVAHRAHPAAFWWIEIAPRGGGGAGFELSSGLHMLAHSPERTADEMRQALPA